MQFIVLTHFSLLQRLLSKNDMILINSVPFIWAWKIQYFYIVKTIWAIYQIPQAFGTRSPKIYFVKQTTSNFFHTFSTLNGMLRHSLGGAVNFISLQHFIAPAFDVMPCLQAQGTRDCNKGIKFKKGAKFIMALFNKMDSSREVKFTRLVDPRWSSGLSRHYEVYLHHG